MVALRTVYAMRILLAEDDEALGRFVRQGLEAENHTVEIFADGEQAKNAATESEFDLVVLDLNLPKLDGVSVLRHLRMKKPSLPVLVLTQRTRVEDRVQCLDLGADDYLGKPFSFSELSARLRALVRRSHLPSESVLLVADLKLDRVERRVERAGRRIELTTKEFSLLEYLMRNAGRRVTRSMIIEHVWNLTFDTTTNVVDVYIFGRGQKAESLRGAVVGLGFQRVSDIAMSCGVLNMMPRDSKIDPVAFWEHSLGCALVCRHFARKIAYPDPGKAYLAGLLHDLGIVVNLWLLPNEFARRQRERRGNHLQCPQRRRLRLHSQAALFHFARHPSHPERSSGENQVRGPLPGASRSAISQAPAARVNRNACHRFPGPDRRRARHLHRRTQGPAGDSAAFPGRS